MKRWMVQVLLFLGVSLSMCAVCGLGQADEAVNNYAFGLKIPVTVHIIFRSGGECDISENCILAERGLRVMCIHVNRLASRWKTIFVWSSGKSIMTISFCYDP